MQLIPKLPALFQKPLIKTISFVFLVVCLAALSGYFYWRYQQEIKKNPAYELNQITSYLETIMELPDSPPPTLATVTEKDKLQQQGFFKHAENGDKVLIYLEEGKAILYRPSTKKIIDVAPISQPDESEQSTNSQANPTAIALLNGTSVSGMARTVEQKLDALDFSFEVARRGNASRFNHATTIVTDTTGKLDSQARALAALIGGQVGSLPEGESAGDVSGLIVIIGSDSTAAPSPQPAN